MIKMAGSISLETIAVGMLQSNCYLLIDDVLLQAVMIDPGDEPEKIKKIIKKNSLRLAAIFLTHGHYDHIGAVSDFNVPVYMHKDDAPLVRQGGKSIPAGEKAPAFLETVKFVQDGEVVSIGSHSLRVIHTPGHTPGSMCLLAGELLFSGDTLFNDGIGRTDLPGGSYAKISASIRQKLFTLPEKTVVLPGHGPSTTITREKAANTYV